MQCHICTLGTTYRAVSALGIIASCMCYVAHGHNGKSTQLTGQCVVNRPLHFGRCRDASVVVPASGCKVYRMHMPPALGAHLGYSRHQGTTSVHRNSSQLSQLGIDLPETDHVMYVQHRHILSAQPSASCWRVPCSPPRIQPIRLQHVLGGAQTSGRHHLVAIE